MTRGKVKVEEIGTFVGCKRSGTKREDVSSHICWAFRLWIGKWNGLDVFFCLL